MRGYGKECDWWSLGAVFFECLIGHAPFCSEEPGDTYNKIVDWPTWLCFPEELHISLEAEDLIRRSVEMRTGLPRLITSHRMIIWTEYRLNVNQIKGHPFFHGADWSTIRQIRPPFVPRLQSSTDNSYFPIDDLADVPVQVEQVEAVGAEQDLAFLRYVVYSLQKFSLILLFLLVHI